jgi:hypothetical protein
MSEHARVPGPPPPGGGGESQVVKEDYPGVVERPLQIQRCNDCRFKTGQRHLHFPAAFLFLFGTWVWGYAHPL